MLKLKIGVMGSASGPQIKDRKARKLSCALGEEVARRDCIMVTGACPGLPYDAALGCRKHGGFVLGVSPAFSHHEHTKEYRSPDDAFDFILYSGLGFMERDIVNIRSADGIILLGGGIGTLNEFTVAFEEGKPVGILTGLPGVSAYIPQIVKWCERDLSSNIVLDQDPVKLVDRLIAVIRKYPTPIHEDGRVKDVKFGRHRG